MTVSVLQSDIDLSRKRSIPSALHNPIALALQHKDRFVVVTPQCVHFIKGVFALPLHVAAWMKAYFDGLPVNPITFELVGVSL